MCPLFRQWAGRTITNGWGATVIQMDLPGEMWMADGRELAVEDFDAVTDRLIADFAGQVPDGIVVDQAVRAWGQLLAAGLLTGLGPAAESLARARLRVVAAAGGHEMK